jgi:hypothetical protein
MRTKTKKRKNAKVHDLKPPEDAKGGGKVRFSEITITKPVDKSSHLF